MNFIRDILIIISNLLLIQSIYQIYQSPVRDVPETVRFYRKAHFTRLQKMCLHIRDYKKCALRGNADIFLAGFAKKTPSLIRTYRKYFLCRYFYFLFFYPIKNTFICIPVLCMYAVRTNIF